ncbi:MAG: DUF6142 family protein [Lachnospiraceae bacterium]|nr:DUF6142 family protein [Lachnospiraceae bacterium]
MRRRSRNVKFTNKGYSRVGILSLALSALSLVWLIYAVCQAFLLGEKAGNVLGGVGMLALMLQICSLVFAARALREEDVFRGIPKVAAGFSVVLLFLWAAVYGLGIYTIFV